mgnify:CR=1 FL=1
MIFEENAIYHIYNRSNEILFRSREDYLFFIQKVEAFLLPCCDVLAWCLLPNHFHLMIRVKAEGVAWSDTRFRYKNQRLAEKLSFLVGTYTQGVNRRYGRRGHLFAHSTKAKRLNDESVSYFNDFGQVDYVTTCFLYIHQTPVMAGLVDDPSQWEMSSFNDYTGKSSGSFVNKEVAYQHLALAPHEIEIQSTSYLDDMLLNELY